MIKLFVDGSATPNPGLGGIGFVLYDDDKQIMHGYTFLGENITNNQAEFLAVVHSLFHVINVFQPKELEINTDSEIVHSVFLGKKQLRSDKLVDIFKAGFISGDVYCIVQNAKKKVRVNMSVLIAGWYLKIDL